MCTTALYLCLLVPLKKSTFFPSIVLVTNGSGIYICKNSQVREVKIDNKKNKKKNKNKHKRNNYHQCYSTRMRHI